MENLDIDKVIDGLSNPAVGANSLDILAMLDELNKVLGKVQHTMSMMDSMGLKPLLVRAAGSKLGVDAESPLRGDVDAGVAPTSDYHRQVFQQFNQMDETQLGQVVSSLLSTDAKKAMTETEKGGDLNG